MLRPIFCSMWASQNMPPSPKHYWYGDIFDDSLSDTEQFCIPSHRTAQCTHCAQCTTKLMLRPIFCSMWASAEGHSRVILLLVSSLIFLFSRVKKTWIIFKIIFCSMGHQLRVILGSHCYDLCPPSYSYFLRQFFFWISWCLLGFTL